MTISKREEFLKNNPDVEQLLSAPNIVSGVGTFGYKKKPDDAFRDKLREIKKHHKGSSIDVK